MCSGNLQSKMTTTKIVSGIDIVCAVALIIAGAVAASCSLPKWCEEQYNYDCDPYERSSICYNYKCREDYDAMNRLVTSIALWGTLPGIVTLVFGIFGFLAAMKKVKWMIGVLLAFTIIGCTLSAIGIFLPFLGAMFTATCEFDWGADPSQSSGDIRSTKEGRDFCDRYAGSLWAVVVLNIILTILQLVLSIILCGLCCSNQTVWDQTGGGTAPSVPMQHMGGTPANVPGQPAFGQPAQQGFILEATPVK